jgi:hypothetical protein
MFFKPLFSLLLALPLLAHAVDINWSGFGTVGYAISDQSYNYQRFINDQGTFKRDSVFGLQIDLKFSQEWGATIQGRLAPAANSDAHFEPSLAWAFLSWRPSDDILLRAGKLRVPFMLNTENQDVGVTYPYARLPVEVYATAPTTDIYGAMLSKTWQSSEFEWGLDGYFGKLGYYQRFHGRDMTLENQTGGTWFEPTTLKGGGLLFSLRDSENIYRIGIHRIETQRDNGGIISEPAFTALPFPPGEGFYDLASSPQVKKTVSPLLVLGSTISLPMGFRASAEYSRVRVTNATNGWDRWAAYAALSKQVGAWTPYVYYSKLSSGSGVLQLYEKVENNRVSAPWPAAINTSQRFAADMLIAHDQSTWALGTSYRLNPSTLIKTELSQTRSGIVTSFIDAPSGSDSADKRINLFSLSCNFTF